LDRINIWINCYCRHSSLSPSSSIIFFFWDEEFGWMDDGTNGWKRRPDTTASGQNQGYYISRYIYVCVFWCFTSSNTLRAKHFRFKSFSILPMIGAYFKNTILKTICAFDVTLNIIYRNIQRNFLLYLEGTLCLWIFFLEKKRRKVIHLLKGERNLMPLV
jgi:hypothetical protein